jgi:hypothetical protein
MLGLVASRAISASTRRLRMSSRLGRVLPRIAHRWNE